MDREEYISHKDSHVHGDGSFPVAAYWVLDPPGASAHDQKTEFVNLPLHWHDEAEIFYMIKGGCLFFIDDGEFPLNEGEAVFVRPGALHWAKLTRPSEAAVSVSVTFHPDFLTGSGQDVTSSKYLPLILEDGRLADPVINRSSAYRSRILDDFLEIVGFFDDSACDIGAEEHKDVTLRLREDEDGSELRIKSLFFDIFYMFIKQTAPHAGEYGMSRSSYRCLLRSIQYLHEHYNEKLTLSELSSRAMMSEGHFSRVFMRYMGKSPFEYLNAYRVNRSIGLLVNTDMKIIDIASESGFQNVSYYNRRFREIMHCTPTEYRENNSASRYRASRE